MRSASVLTLESCTRSCVIYFNLAWVEWVSVTFAVGAVNCTYGSFYANHFFPYISPSGPVFVSGPEVIIGEKFFSYDLLFFRIRVVPGMKVRFRELVLFGPNQCCAFILEGFILRVLA